jgi:RNA polymerase sigma factor (TIGR02999 family)
VGRPSASASNPDITGLLNDARRGDREAEARVFRAIVHELRRTAAAFLRRERRGHTLSPTALVNEAYIKLVGVQQIAWQNRAQFFGTAARVMRRILVDHARARAASKRGGRGQAIVTFDPNLAPANELDAFQVLALDRALDRLAHLDARQARIVECRCFAGFDVRETADALGISPTTVKREWHVARAWLYRELHGSPSSDAVASSPLATPMASAPPAAIVSRVS